MNWPELERHFSPARLGRYKKARSGDEHLAMIDYTLNLQLAEAMFPILNVLEIALRNGVHNRLCAVYHRQDWWAVWHSDTTLKWQLQQIHNVKEKLKKRAESQTTDKIVAELNFAFWVSLFNKRKQNQCIDLWKELRLVFAHCPKAQRQRHHVASALNQIRKLRNRVFHHESLLWLSPDLIEQHKNCTAVLNWIDPKLAAWTHRYDRLPGIWYLTS
ncbi:MAG: hypothetical protein ACRC5A_15690 [Enterobacteriaceae bacterium]